MKLEKRKCDFIEDTGHSKIFKLKCSQLDYIKLKQYVIEEDELCAYEKDKNYSWRIRWTIKSKEDNVGTGTTIKPNSGKEITIWDDHVVFIIPKLFEKTLHEGFYEKGKYPNTSEALAYYVRNLTTNEDYCLQFCGGGGDTEYTWLESMCNIENALLYSDEFSFDKTDKGKQLVEMSLPLGIRRNIKVDIPYEEVDNLINN